MSGRARIVVALVACAVVNPQATLASAVDKLERHLQQVEQQCVQVETQLKTIAANIADAERQMKYLSREFREAPDKVARQWIRSRLRVAANARCALISEHLRCQAQMDKLLAQARELEARIKHSSQP